MPTNPQNLLAQISETLNRPEVQEPLQTSISLYLSNLGMLKAAGILLTAFFAGAAVFFAVRTGWLAVRVDRVQDVILKSNLPKKKSIKAWREIKRKFFAGDDSSLKLAIIEADTVLSEALRLAGFRGVNLGERLKAITPAQLPNLQQVWEAHKLRNRLVHEPDFRIRRDVAERALAVYEQTFRDLGLLD